MSTKLEELCEIIDRIDGDTPPAVKHEIFTFIRKWWTELGEDLTISSRICSKLDISRAMFNLYINNPELVYGLETLHRNIRDGWLRTYLDYTSGHEAPEDFHVWVGLTVMASTLRRKVWFDNHFYKLYPNLYTILVSPPGVGKKTTAIGIGVDLLKAAIGGDCRIINEKVTPEALVDLLSKPIEKRKDTGGVKVEPLAEALILAPELTVFLGREQYNEGLIILLTRLYDCPGLFDASTVSRGTRSLKNVWASMLGATTPSEIAKAIPSSATGGGFTSRLHIVQKDSSPRFFPFAIPNDPTMRELLVDGLVKASEMAGPFVFNHEAKDWYTDYYRRHKEAFEKGLMIGANSERQPDHLIKVAMIMSVAEGLGMEFNVDVLQRSYNIIYATMMGTKDVLKMIDSSERGKANQLIVETIKNAGGVLTRSLLTKKLYRKLDAKDISIALETLVEAKVVDKYLKDKITYLRLTSFEEVPE